MKKETLLLCLNILVISLLIAFVYVNNRSIHETMTQLEEVRETIPMIPPTPTPIPEYRLVDIECMQLDKISDEFSLDLTKLIVVEYEWWVESNVLNVSDLKESTDKLYDQVDLMVNKIDDKKGYVRSMYAMELLYELKEDLIHYKDILDNYEDLLNGRIDYDIMITRCTLAILISNNIHYNIARKLSALNTYYDLYRPHKSSEDSVDNESTEATPTTIPHKNSQ